MNQTGGPRTAALEGAVKTEVAQLTHQGRVVVASFKQQYREARSGDTGSDDAATATRPHHNVCGDTQATQTLALVSMGRGVAGAMLRITMSQRPNSLKQCMVGRH